MALHVAFRELFRADRRAPIDDIVVEGQAGCAAPRAATAAGIQEPGRRRGPSSDLRGRGHNQGAAIAAGSHARGVAPCAASTAGGVTTVAGIQAEGDGLLAGCSSTAAI